MMTSRGDPSLPRGSRVPAMTPGRACPVGQDSRAGTRGEARVRSRPAEHGPLASPEARELWLADPSKRR